MKPQATFLLALGIAGVVVAIGLTRLATKDDLETIEDTRVLSAASAACSAAGEPTSAILRAEAAQSVADAVRALPAAVLDDDFPSRAWADDWARVAAAQRVVPFVLPDTGDGAGLVERLQESGPEGCRDLVLAVTR